MIASKLLEIRVVISQSAQNSQHWWNAMDVEPELTQRDILIEVSRLYYEQRLTQTVIGRRYSLSRSTVSRMLQRARELGIVTITVNHEVARNSSMEEALGSAFGLRDVRVLRSGDRSPDAIRIGIGQLAARLLRECMEECSILGVSYGRSIANTVEQGTTNTARRTHRGSGYRCPWI